MLKALVIPSVMLAPNNISNLFPQCNHQYSTHQKKLDDTLLMGHPSIQEALKLKKILDNFVVASGTDFNKIKITNIFLQHPQAIQIHIPHPLVFKNSSLPSKYLGASLTANPLRILVLGDFPLKFEEKLSKSTFWALNFVGHFTILKFVLKYITTYLLLALSTPKITLNKICNLQHSFL